MLLQHKALGLRCGDQRPRAIPSPGPTALVASGARSLEASNGRPGEARWTCSSASVVKQLEERQDTHRHASTSAADDLQAPPARPELLSTNEQASCSKPTTSASVTPSKLAALSLALRMPVKQIQQLLQQSPELLSLPPEQLAALQHEIQEGLGISKHGARQLVSRQPRKVLSTPVPELQNRIRDLAKCIGVSEKAVSKAVGLAPSMIGREADVVASQLQRMALALGGIPMADMLQLAATATQFLTDSPASIETRLAEFSRVLHRQPWQVVRALKQQPDMLFMSPRVLRNKLAVLQAILDRPPRLVVPILLACPGLLRCDMDAVRAAYGMLRPISQRDADFSFGMVCHAPHLLLHHPQLLASQARHVHQMARLVPHWHAQLSKLNPAQVADLLGQSAPTYARLNYLAATLQAGGLSLHEALTLPRSTFLKHFPGAASLKDAVKQPMQLQPVPRWQGQSSTTTSHALARTPDALMQARRRAREEAFHHERAQRHATQLQHWDGALQNGHKYQHHLHESKIQLALIGHGGYAGSNGHDSEWGMGAEGRWDGQGRRWHSDPAHTYDESPPMRHYAPQQWRTASDPDASWVHQHQQQHPNHAGELEWQEGDLHHEVQHGHSRRHARQQPRRKAMTARSPSWNGQHALDEGPQASLPAEQRFMDPSSVEQQEEAEQQLQPVQHSVFEQHAPGRPPFHQPGTYMPAWVGQQEEGTSAPGHEAVHGNGLSAVVDNHHQLMSEYVPGQHVVLPVSLDVSTSPPSAAMSFVMASDQEDQLQSQSVATNDNGHLPGVAYAQGVSTPAHEATDAMPEISAVEQTHRDVQGRRTKVSKRSKPQQQQQQGEYEEGRDDERESMFTGNGDKASLQVIRLSGQQPPQQIRQGVLMRT